MTTFARLICSLASVFITATLVQAQTEPDEGCTSETPARCPRPDPYKSFENTALDRAVGGQCMKDYSQCPIAQICYLSENSYQCPDGICMNRPDKCYKQNLNCQSVKQTRCSDGYCRTQCQSVRYSSCPRDNPLLCPQGKCVKYTYQCAGGHYCDLNTPFLCPDMSCGINIRSCGITNMGRTFDTLEVEYEPNNPKIDKMSKTYKTANLEFGIQFDAFNSPEKSPFYGQKITTKAKMIIKPVDLDTLRNVRNILNSTLAGVVKDYYMISEESIPYQITIRSSAFQISTVGRNDDNEYFNTSITLIATINSIRRGENSVSNLSVKQI